MLLVDAKLFFRSQKDLKLIYLWASITFELWLVIHFQHQKSICIVTGDGCLVFPSKPKKTTNSFTYEHWNYVGYTWSMTKNQCWEWLVMIGWCFQPNYWYIHFWYVIAYWKIISQKSERPQTHLLTSFNSTSIMTGFTWKSPKINMWRDWWWLLHISSQTIVMCFFNMLLLNGKYFSEIKKTPILFIHKLQ